VPATRLPGIRDQVLGLQDSPSSRVLRTFSSAHSVCAGTEHYAPGGCDGHPTTGITEPFPREDGSTMEGGQGAVTGSRKGLKYGVSQLSVEVTGEEPEGAVGLERW
jgi:hypothetical protein